MSSVTLQEAERDFGAVLQRVLAGEEIVIAEAGRPVVIVSPARSARQPGGAEGRIAIPDDFDAPLPEGTIW